MTSSASGTALPRAVPSDAVVAVLDEVVPGMLLQKVVLVGALVGGGIGAARLAGRSVVVRMVAVSVYVWSPFVIERLWIGQWPVLLCWRCCPGWCRPRSGFRVDGRLGTAIPFLLLVGSLSVNAGVMSGLVVLAVGLVRRRGPALRLVLAVVAANAPWVVAGLLHAGTATTTATSVFSLRGEGSLPAPLTALGLGGIWNASVVPSSRDSVVAWVALVLFVGVAVVGARPLWRRLGRRTAGALVAVWVVGFAVAMWSWAAPGSVAWWAEHVPGGGIVRDGARALALCAPLTAALVASGVGRLADLPTDHTLRVMLGVAGALVPVALIPDAAWGLAGNLHPASYPDDYAAARSVLADPPDGDLLVLPFTSYRAPSWNHDRRVLDPLPRYLAAQLRRQRRARRRRPDPGGGGPTHAAGAGGPRRADPASTARPRSGGSASASWPASSTYRRRRRTTPRWPATGCTKATISS